MWPQKTIPKKTPTKKFQKLTLTIWHHELKNHKIMLVQMVLFPPLTHELQILWQHVPMKKKSIIMKNDTLNKKSDTYNG
jgi:hypothetical protein